MLTVCRWALASFAIMSVFEPVDCHAQNRKDQALSKGSQEQGMIAAEIQRLVRDAKIGEQLELTPSQRKQLLIVIQRTQDTMMKMGRPAPGQKVDFEKLNELNQKLLDESQVILSDKQWEKLTELAKARQQKQKPFSQEAMQQLQRQSSLMGELMTLSYDPKLAEKLEITVEQRIELREVQQRFQKAMQENSQRAQGGDFDMENYNRIMGDLMVEAQGILTPEQSERLARSAKLKRLKQQHGDAFAMINGLISDYGLKPADVASVKEEINSARDEYYQKLEQLQQDTLNRILEEIPPEHHDEIREAVTEFFQKDPRQR